MHAQAGHGIQAVSQIAVAISIEHAIYGEWLAGLKLSYQSNLPIPAVPDHEAAHAMTHIEIRGGSFRPKAAGILRERVETAGIKRVRYLIDRMRPCPTTSELKVAAQPLVHR